MLYDTWKCDADGAFKHEDNDACFELPEPLAFPVELSVDTRPILSVDDLLARAQRLDRFREACREIYRYVDQLDEDMRETGECDADPLAIVDEVKRLISKAYL